MGNLERLSDTELSAVVVLPFAVYVYGDERVSEASATTASLNSEQSGDLYILTCPKCQYTYSRSRTDEPRYVFGFYRASATLLRPRKGSTRAYKDAYFRLNRSILSIVQDIAGLPQVKINLPQIDAVTASGLGDYTGTGTPDTAPSRLLTTPPDPSGNGDYVSGLVTPPPSSGGGSGNSYKFNGERLNFTIHIGSGSMSLGPFGSFDNYDYEKQCSSGELNVCGFYPNCTVTGETPSSPAAKKEFPEKRGKHLEQLACGTYVILNIRPPFLGCL
jgi:ssDNA-binding Zn-finger/Zn-ribbon topoisomerase 1